MRRRRRWLVAVAAVLVVASAAFGSDDPRAERYELANGLDVILRPIEGHGPVALLTFFDLGDDHDPAELSGLAHLIEHVYVTAAAGERAATSAEQWMARYGSQVNAQTGRDYTVIAVVFDNVFLDEELKDAAARLGALGVESSDLDRELPRLDAELKNMYALMPHLAVHNLASATASPQAEGARKSGLIEQIRAITLEDVRDRLARYYKPANARLVLVGGFEPEVARERIQAWFGSIPRGEPVPAPRAAAPPPGSGSIETIRVPRPEYGRFPDGLAAVAWRVPAPSSPDYAPFLVIFGNLFRQIDFPVLPVISPVTYMPLDRPDVIVLGAEITPEESPEATVAFLRGRAADASLPKDIQSVTAGYVIEQLGPVLGFSDFPDFMLSEHPYSIGFMLGRRAQLGIEPRALLKKLGDVTAEDLRRVGQTWFPRGSGAAVVVHITDPVAEPAQGAGPMSLLVTGTVGIDTIHTPRGKAEGVLGGSCSYFAAAASLRGPVRVVAAVGGDFPAAHRRTLERFKNICLDGLQQRPASRTFAWGGRYFENMNQRETLFTQLGVLEEDPPPIPRSYRDSRYIFVANTHPMVQARVLDEFPNRALAVADTMDLWINVARPELLQVLSRVDGLVLNDGEAALLTECNNVVTAARMILEMGPTFVVVKKGEHGCVLVHQDGVAVLPAWPAELEKVVDPTGAGDAFAGGIMAHLAAEDRRDFEAIQASLAWGTVTASFVIESFGLKRLLEIDGGDLEERLEVFRRLAWVG